MKKIIYLVVTVCIGSGKLFSFAPTNFFRPHEATLQIPYTKNTLLRAGFFAEHGSRSSRLKKCDATTRTLPAGCLSVVTSTAYNLLDDKACKSSCFASSCNTACPTDTCSKEKRCFLNLYDSSESVIAMLFNPLCLVTDKAADVLNSWMTSVGGPSTDDGVRGHVQFCGSFAETNATVWAHINFLGQYVPGILSFGMYLPFKSIEIKNISLVDFTRNLFMTDKLIKNFIKTLDQQTKELGDLDMGDYKESGVGDLTILLDWAYWLKAENRVLQTISFFLKWGMSVPVSQRRNVDKVFSFALGNDGAWECRRALASKLNVHSISKPAFMLILCIFLAKSRYGD